MDSTIFLQSFSFLYVALLFVAFLCMDLCNVVSTMPICAFGHTGCQLLSLADLFDRVIRHSARMHGLSSDLHSELVSTVAFYLFIYICILKRHDFYVLTEINMST